MKTINIELTEQEAQNLTVLLDVAVKSLGLKSIAPILPLLQKLEAAAQAANVPPPAETVDSEGDPLMDATPVKKGKPNGADLHRAG